MPSVKPYSNLEPRTPSPEEKSQILKDNGIAEHPDYTPPERYSQPPLPTVKVEDGAGGFVVINQADFDKDSHKLYADTAGESSL